MQNILKSSPFDNYIDDIEAETFRIIIKIL
jgi:hypothetical protein